MMKHLWLATCALASWNWVNWNIFTTNSCLHWKYFWWIAKTVVPTGWCLLILQWQFWSLQDFSHLAESCCMRMFYLNTRFFTICVLSFVDLSPSFQHLWMASGLLFSFLIPNTYFTILFCASVHAAHVVSFFLLLVCGCVIANLNLAIPKFSHACVSDIQYLVHVTPTTSLMASSLQRPTWAAPTCFQRGHPPRAPACSRPRRPWAEWGWELW